MFCFLPVSTFRSGEERKGKKRLKDFQFLTLNRFKGMRNMRNKSKSVPMSHISARKEGKIFSKWVGQQGQRDRQPTDNEKLSHFKIFKQGHRGQNLIYAHGKRKKKKEKLTREKIIKNKFLFSFRARISISTKEIGFSPESPE